MKNNKKKPLLLSNDFLLLYFIIEEYFTEKIIIHIVVPAHRTGLCYIFTIDDRRHLLHTLMIFNGHLEHVTIYITAKKSHTKR